MANPFWGSWLGKEFQETGNGYKYHPIPGACSNEEYMLDSKYGFWCPYCYKSSNRTYTWIALETKERNLDVDECPIHGHMKYGTRRFMELIKEVEEDIKKRM